MDTPSNASVLLVLTDQLYLPGTIRLLESFFHHNGKIPAIALSRDPQALIDPRLKALTIRQVEVDPEPYTTIRPYKKRHSQRHSETFFKFEAFQDFGYERNLFLDSDILCLNPTPLLLENSSSSLLAALDSGFKPTRSYKGHPNEINSGVLSIPRALLGISTVQELQEIARNEPGRGGYNSGDQSVINKWIHRKNVPLTLLPESYNLIKKDYFDSEGLESCKLLHFCDRKPWFTGFATSSPLIKIWHAHQP